jgi:hypothetical protein
VVWGEGDGIEALEKITWDAVRVLIELCFLSKNSEDFGEGSILNNSHRQF